MKHQNRIRFGWFREEFFTEKFFVVVIQGPIYVATFILVFKSAINDLNLAIMVIILAANNVNKDSAVYTRKTIRFIVWDEMRQVQFRGCIDVYYRLKSGTGRQRALVILLQNLLRVLKHAD